MPPRPERAAMTSAAASAASVFPSPMGASITSIPGSSIDHAASIALLWTGRIAAPCGSSKRSWKSSGRIACATLCCQEGMIPAFAHPLDARRARALKSTQPALTNPPSLPMGSNAGKNRSLLASQSAMMINPAMMLAKGAPTEQPSNLVRTSSVSPESFRARSINSVCTASQGASPSSPAPAKPMRFAWSRASRMSTSREGFPWCAPTTEPSDQETRWQTPASTR